jgi:cytolysin (calcineurin-like family phosphatase)
MGFPLLLLSLCVQATPAPAVAETTPEVTFLISSDTHYGQDQWANNESLNKQAINRMNGLEGTFWPSEAGGVVRDIRGVIVPGDLTDSGTDSNLFGYWFFGHVDGFVDDYKVLGGTGNNVIHYPVYEGYGNHDIHNSATGVVKSEIASRNAQRPNLANVSSNGYHYSFDWENIHFINLNVYPGGAGDAEFSLDFLIQDLATEVGTSDRPVVIYHHYGFDPFGRDWWTADERQEYLDALEGYHVIAIFSGHNHSAARYQRRDIPCFNAPRAKDQRFLAVRISAGQLVVAERSTDSWGSVWLERY